MKFEWISMVEDGGVTRESGREEGRKILVLLRVE